MNVMANNWSIGMDSTKIAKETCKCFEPCCPKAHKMPKNAVTVGHGLLRRVQESADQTAESNFHKLYLLSIPAIRRKQIVRPAPPICTLSRLQLVSGAWPDWMHASPAMNPKHSMAE